LRLCVVVQAVDISDSRLPNVEGAGFPGPFGAHHFDCGTTGPEGAAGAGAGAAGAAGCGLPCKLLSSPPGASGGGAPGAGALGPSGFSCSTEAGLRFMPARIDSTRLVTKNSPAKIAVVRVSTLPAPRLVMNPPVEPIPSPPPSERCSSTTPIKA